MNASVNREQRKYVALLADLEAEVQDQLAKRKH